MSRKSGIADAFAAVFHALFAVAAGLIESLLHKKAACRLSSPAEIPQRSWGPGGDIRPGPPAWKNRALQAQIPTGSRQLLPAIVAFLHENSVVQQWHRVCVF